METQEKIFMTLVRQRFLDMTPKTWIKRRAKPKTKNMIQRGKKNKNHKLDWSNWGNFCSSLLLTGISPSNQSLYSSWREKSVWWWRPRQMGVQVRTILQSPSSQRALPEHEKQRGQPLRCLYRHCSNFSYPSSLLSQLHWPACCPSDLSQWCFCFWSLGLALLCALNEEPVNTCGLHCLQSSWGSQQI